MEITPAPPGRQEVLKRGLNSFHESLADYTLMNPGATLREKAAYFGYSISWISIVENSDMYRAYFALRRKEVQFVIADSLPEKLAAAASLATDRVIEVLEASNDADTILDAFDKVMHRYGYAPKGQGAAVAPGMNQQGNIQNNFYIGADDLAKAREQLIGAHKPTPALEQKEDKAGDPVSTD